MASREIGVPPPGRASERPKLLFRFAPSTVKFVERPSEPAKLMPLAYGLSLVRAARLRPEFGRFIISSLEMLVLAPVLVAAKREAGVATTTASFRDSTSSFR